MVTRAIYVSLYICQWIFPEWYKNTLTSCSCNLLHILLICQHVKELVLSLPLWFRVKCSIVQCQSVISLVAVVDKNTSEKNCISAWATQKEYCILQCPASKWPALGVCHIAELPHPLCAVLARPSTKTEAPSLPVPHCPKKSFWQKECCRSGLCSCFLPFCTSTPLPFSRSVTISSASPKWSFFQML